MKRLFLCLLLALLFAPSLDASNRYDPRLRFRTLTTPRFDIYFHQGEDRLARRLGVIAEAVADELAPRLGRPRARVHIILVDQTDLSNGWATPVPYNLIEIVAASPRAESQIGNTSEWLRLVFTHEYTHVLHLERSRGLFGRIGRVFGRNPFFYPNLLLPPWQIEGLATFHESATSREGRMHAGDFRMIAERAARAGRFPTLDRASNDLVQWPGGTAPYLYGGLFHQYLADRYGEASLTRLADATAGRLPFFGSPAFKDVFGKSLGSLWEDFERESVQRAPSDGATPRQLTHHGFTVKDPWFMPVTGDLVYSVSNPHGFPALMLWAESGPAALTTRFGGEQIGGRGLRTVVFDQVEYVQSVALQSDLYERDARQGDVRRLTREARAGDPDVSLDGTIVCIVQGVEGRAVATMAIPVAGSVGIPTVIAAESGVDYASPRWSPDGASVVVERRAIGGPSEIVVLDGRTGALRQVVTASTRGRNGSPVWSPDGRTIYFASDRDGGPFQIYAADRAGGAIRRLENAGVSAQSPAISPDAATLVFVGYTPAGYDLFSLPLEEARWVDVPSPADPVTAAPPLSGTSAPAARISPYSPLKTLLPRFWTPVIEENGEEAAFGAAISGADALGRHAYAASAAWSTRGRPDWTAAYAYDRWRPTLFADFSDDQEPFLEGDLRVRELNAGALMSFRTVRRTQTIVGTYHAAHEALDCGGCEPSRVAAADRRALRAGWILDAARGFGYSISDEEGFRVSLSAEWTAESLGADGDSTAVIADVRGYRAAGPRHAVLAGRLAGARAGGDDSVRRLFGAGGATAGLPLLDFDLGAIGLVRGFDSSDVVGRSAVVANLDYRVPLLWIERGSGTWPLFLRSLHGAIFADAGSAWDQTRTSDDWRASFGAELAGDVVVGFSLPITISVGIAVRHDPTRRADGAAFFARIGRAF